VTGKFGPYDVARGVHPIPGPATAFDLAVDQFGTVVQGGGWSLSGRVPRYDQLRKWHSEELAGPVRAGGQEGRLVEEREVSGGRLHRAPRITILAHPDIGPIGKQKEQQRQRHKSRARVSVPHQNQGQQRQRNVAHAHQHLRSVTLTEHLSKRPMALKTDDQVNESHRESRDHDGARGKACGSGTVDGSPQRASSTGEVIDRNGDQIPQDVHDHPEGGGEEAPSHGSSVGRAVSESAQRHEEHGVAKIDDAQNADEARLREVEADCAATETEGHVQHGTDSDQGQRDKPKAKGRRAVVKCEVECVEPQSQTDQSHR
jgi:hypothetical protein